MKIDGLNTKWGGAKAISMHTLEVALILACVVAVFWINRSTATPSTGAAVDHGHAAAVANDSRHGAPSSAP